MSTLQSLEGFARYATRQGVAFTTVYVPMPQELAAPSGLEEWLGSTLQEHGIAWISHREALETSGGRLYFEHDGHWTARAHAIVATVLADHLSGTYALGRAMGNDDLVTPEPHGVRLGVAGT